MKKIYVLFLLSLCGCLTSYMSVYAQKRKPAPSKPTAVLTRPKQTPVLTTPKTQSGQKSLTNADVIRMVRGGFGESIVINAIQTNETQFDLSLDALFELKNAGVSQKVIEAMQVLQNRRQQQIQAPLNTSQSIAADNSSDSSEQKSPPPPKVVISDASENKQASAKNTSGADVPEVSINADMDTVRTVLIRRFTGQGFVVDKDQPNQLVFNKEVGGVKGFMTGLLLGRQQNNPRQILTFVLTKTGNGISVLAKLAIVYPNNSGLGNPHDFNNKKVRKELVKELTEVKKEAEK